MPAIGMALWNVVDSGPLTARALGESARLIEDAGFSSIWAPDTVGRRETTRSLDPFAALSVAAAVTEKIELGTCVVQVPLRRRVELAHRALSLHLLTEGRFTFGVGAGSTQADFDAVGVPFESRFRELSEALPDMKALWRGERVGDAALYPWEEAVGGPPILIGSWAGKWVERSAREFDGWIASGTRTWRALGEAAARFKAAGGTRAVISTVFADLTADGGPPDEEDRVHLVCPPEEAARRVARLGEMGFTDVVVFYRGPAEGLGGLAALGKPSP